MLASSGSAARHRCLAALVVGLAIGASAAAQTGLPGLLRDVAESPAPNWGQLVPGPAVFVPLGGELYFASWDLTEGLELRATDGTAAGTRTVRDVCPGSCGGFTWVELVESGGILYFGADDGVHDRELWRSDGTRAGTRRVAPPGGPTIAPMPEFITAAPGGVYFVALDAAHGSELWWSDGTAAGTHLVVDLWPGSLPEGGAGPSDLTWLAGAGLVFAADDGVHGRELWITQGGAATTQLLADVRPGAAAGIEYRQAYPNAYGSPVVSGGKVYFAADDGAHGGELWVTDGTPAGTSLVADLAPGLASAYPSSFFAFGSDLLFGASGPGSLRTLWRTNGTAAGTVALGDAAHGTQQLSPTGYGLLGGVVYFAGWQAATGRELWRTDGTLEGTALAVEIQPGPQTGIVGYRGFTAAAGRLWFPGDDGAHGSEWWQSDGTGGGTFQVADLVPGPGWGVDGFSVPFPREVDGHVLLAGFDSERAFALRAGEPGVVGAAVVHAAGDRAGSALFCTLWNCPTQVTPVAGGVAFAAFDGPHGGETWRSDGTEAGTRLAADIAPGPNSSAFYWRSVHARASLGDDLLLVASDCVTQSCDDASVQLRRVDVAGNVTALTAEPWSVAPGDLTAWDGAGYLATEGGLWKSDGTAAGTALLDAAALGAHWFTPASEALYFAAGALWRSDGSGGGTAALDPGFAYGVSARPVVAADGSGHDRLYFTAGDAVAGNELWTSDGSDAGTRRVVDLRPGPAASIPTLNLQGFEEVPLLATVGGDVFFAADDGVAGDELWMSDGSPGNATLLEVRPGAAGSQPRYVTAAGGRVYFVADDGIHGREPWVSDGTAAGTHLVTDVRPGPESSSPQELVDWMGRLVFAADDDVHGMELWRVDAAGAGAQLVVDLRPGVEPASPQGLTAVGERLYFFADDGTTGLEPWVWSAASDLFRDSFETGAVDRWSSATAP